MSERLLFTILEVEEIIGKSLNPIDIGVLTGPDNGRIGMELHQATFLSAHNTLIERQHYRLNRLITKKQLKGK